ncbi:hypothetical protein TNCT_702771 [Trichonephila clavata]|uniref:Uncharacterized protein n=1 Tax=Trichonephila clavata TaxID=2740835 RepID=A0A8X6KQU2_TRICU|nr:hypothetical protein TNCT_702771 [Trichonephila clavata]
MTTLQNHTRSLSSSCWPKWVWQCCPATMQPLSGTSGLLFVPKIKRNLKKPGNFNGGKYRFSFFHDEGAVGISAWNATCPNYCPQVTDTGFVSKLKSPTTFQPEAPSCNQCCQQNNS